MDKKPISISFANQKGGIGKSTLTILAASWLRYVRGLNVLVVDCDFPQNSIVELREREKKAVMKNDAYKLMLQRQFERIPMRADRLVMQSTLNFAQTVYDKFVENPATNIQEVFLFWNMEDRRERTNIYTLYERILATLDMKVYISRIQMRSKFSRELADADGTVYRSTLFRSDGTFLRESGMAALMDEICTTIGI